jgi:carboxyl-terminal processing protease
MLPPDTNASEPRPAPPDGVVLPPVQAGGPLVVRPTPARDRTVLVVALSIAVVSVLAGAALFLSGYTLGRQAATTPGTPVGEQDLFRPFWDTYRAITERYAGGEVDRQKLVEGAIDGMVDSLEDPYSSYLTPDEYKRSLEDINGEFEGVGAEIGTQAADGSETQCGTLGADCRLVIVAPLPGSPAEAAGVRAGDLVSAVDGESLEGLTVDEARDRIRGPKGTEVRLTLVRGGDAPFDLAIVRDVIDEHEVVAEDLAGGTVGHLAVSGFSSDSAADFEQALRERLDRGETKFILDLRGNPGGFVDAARDIASQFIGEGPIFWQEDSRGNQVETPAKSGGAAVDPSIDLIVLVDRGSASASEIVAGALQDTGRARLVGEQTYGKGTVQQWNLLDGDNGGFRLTIAKWLTPEKRWVHEVGLTPDVAVAIAPDAPDGADPVLDRALELLGASTARAGREASDTSDPTGSTDLPRAA